jgi:stage II sporulation protein P
MKNKAQQSHNKIKYALFFILLILVNIPLSVYGSIKFDYTNQDIMQAVLNYGLNSYYTKEIDETTFDIQKNMLSAAQYVLTQTLPTVAGTIKTSDQPDLSDYDQNAQALLNTQYHNGEPRVVIYHTHTTESYNADPSATTYRSTDPTQNMVTIGAIVSQILYEEYGIQVLHITETFDQPYDTAYEKSLAAVQAAIEQYPSIQYAFDIHRDGISYSDTGLAIYKTTVNGNDAAKIMLVVGSTAENYQSNLYFASEIGNKMNEMYPDLFRKTLEKPYKYNQYVAQTCMLFEVGSNLSSMEEAKTSAVYLGKVLGELITQNTQ